VKKNWAFLKAKTIQMKIHKVLKDFLQYPSISKLALESNVINASVTLVSYYYFFLVYMSIDAFSRMDQIVRAQAYEPLWPLAWSAFFQIDQTLTLNIVRFFFVAVTIIGVFTFKSRSGRFLVFLGIWQIHAVLSSFNHPNHQWYPWLYTSFIFIFLPDIWKKSDTEANKKFLLIIWSAQALVLLTYSLSGMWKFVSLFDQVISGQIHGFSKDAFAYQVADFLPRVNYNPLLAEFIINNPVFVWPFYAGSYFLEFFALWTAFRPSLQRFWALGLIIFHLGTFVAMGIQFLPFVAILVILFMNSPFSPAKFSMKQVILDLPVAAQVIPFFGKKFANK
jgi:hypothetical protein